MPCNEAVPSLVPLQPPYPQVKHAIAFSGALTAPLPTSQACHCIDKALAICHIPFRKDGWRYLDLC